MSRECAGTVLMPDLSHAQIARPGADGRLRANCEGCGIELVLTKRAGDEPERTPYAVHCGLVHFAVFDLRLQSDQLGRVGVLPWHWEGQP